jgi:hypothetical protein
MTLTVTTEGGRPPSNPPTTLGRIADAGNVLGACP